jgi:hypothetical protein
LQVCHNQYVLDTCWSKNVFIYPPMRIFHNLMPHTKADGECSDHQPNKVRDCLDCLWSNQRHPYQHGSSGRTYLWSRFLDTRQPSHYQRATTPSCCICLRNLSDFFSICLTTVPYRRKSFSCRIARSQRFFLSPRKGRLPRSISHLIVTGLPNTPSEYL